MLAFELVNTTVVARRLEVIRQEGYCFVWTLGEDATATGIPTVAVAAAKF